jgi:hypothetical protein
MTTLLYELLRARHRSITLLNAVHKCLQLQQVFFLRLDELKEQSCDSAIIFKLIVLGEGVESRAR